MGTGLLHLFPEVNEMLSKVLIMLTLCTNQIKHPVCDIGYRTCNQETNKTVKYLRHELCTYIVKVKGTHDSPLSNGYQGSFPQGKAAKGMKLTTHGMALS